MTRHNNNGELNLESIEDRLQDIKAEQESLSDEAANERIEELEEKKQSLADEMEEWRRRADDAIINIMHDDVEIALMLQGCQILRDRCCDLESDLRRQIAD